MSVRFKFVNMNRVDLVESFPKESEGMELIRILNQKVPIENKYYRISTYASGQPVISYLELTQKFADVGISGQECTVYVTASTEMP